MEVNSYFIIFIDLELLFMFFLLGTLTFIYLVCVWFFRSYFWIKL